MAHPVCFDGANLMLGPPPGQPDSVERMAVWGANGRLASCWKLSAEELAEIARTGVVWMVAKGPGHPNAAIAGERAGARRFLGLTA